MGIQMLLTEKGKYAPVITCDVCGELIKDGRLAMVRHTDLKLGEMGKAIFCHKRECDEEANRKFPELSKSGWTELRHALVWLAHNSGIDINDAAESAKLMEEI